MGFSEPQNFALQCFSCVQQLHNDGIVGKHFFGEMNTGYATGNIVYLFACQAAVEILPADGFVCKFWVLLCHISSITGFAKLVQI